MFFSDGLQISGGPLMYFNRSSHRWTIIGTLEGGGYNCATDRVEERAGRKLGFWNKVSAHMPWIQKTMEDLGETVCNPD